MGIQDSATSLSSLIVLGAVDPISAGVLGLAFILLIVFCVMAAKTWHWVNIVFVILTFIAGVSSVFGLTKVYKLRTDAVKKFDAAEKDLAKSVEAAELAIVGPISSPGYDPGTLRHIDTLLSREFAGRGRVWSRGSVALEADNQNVFTFATARPDGYQPLKEVELYAFLENDQSYPTGFIGSVRVTEESAQSVKLKDVAIADEREFTQPSGNWSLFEKMPLDRRGTFKKAIIAFAETNENCPENIKKFAKDLEDPSVPLDITQFRKIIEVDFLRAVDFNLAPDSQLYEELVDRFVFDDLQLGTIQNWIDQNSGTRATPRFEPKPEEIFIEYEFTKDSNKSYQVDSTGSIENEGQFSPLGYAVDPALQAGGEVRFSQGDRVFIDKPSATGYKRGEQQIAPFSAGEAVTKVGEIYRRPVKDFPYEFVDLTIRSADIDDELARVTQNNLVQTETVAKANGQLAVRDTRINDLSDDEENLKKDNETIATLLAELEIQVQQEEQAIATLNSKIQTTYNEIRKLSLLLTRKAFAKR